MSAHRTTPITTWWIDRKVASYRDCRTGGFSPVSSQRTSDNGNQAGGVEFVHEPLDRELVAELSPALGQQPLDLDLADDVAGAVRRLLQIEVLLDAHEVGRRGGASRAACWRR